MRIAAHYGSPATAHILDTTPLIRGELHHLVVPSTQSHSMVMRVMKDSFENEMPVGEVQYKREPRGMVNNPDPELLAP